MGYKLGFVSISLENTHFPYTVLDVQVERSEHNISWEYFPSVSFATGIYILLVCYFIGS